MGTALGLDITRILSRQTDQREARAVKGKETAATPMRQDASVGHFCGVDNVLVQR